MANPTWFNADYYLKGKLDQLNAIDPDGKVWSENDVKAALKAAGYEGDEGLYQHFVDFGMDENISPNEAFDAMFYLQSKADALNAVNYEGKKWDAASVMDAFKAAGIESAWEHYQMFGSSEGIATSADFDSEAYFVAKVKQLNDTGYEGRSNWTVDEVKAAFAEQGLTALEHYQLYGKDEKLNPADFDTTAKVSDDSFDIYTGVKTYASLEAALDAQADGSLAENYTIESCTDAGDVTVAQQAGIADLLAGATPAIKADPTYTLVDTVDAIANASTAVLMGSDGGYCIKDTLANITAAADGSLVKNAADVTITDLGGDGITVTKIDNYVVGSDTGFVSAAAKPGEPWDTNSKDLLVATNDGDAIKTADLVGKLDWIGGDPGWKGTDEGFVKVLDGNFQNILEGGRGNDTLVGLDGAKDVFLFNSWYNKGDNGGTALGVDTIYNFEVGTDKLMVVSANNSKMLGDKTVPLANKGAHTDMIAYEQSLAGITYDEKTVTATVTIKGSFFAGEDLKDDLVINLIGVTEADVNAAGGLVELFMDAPSA
ncbi:MAG: hypothetical protein MSH27_09210 [Desulfovibrio piger]|uniref:hypothetical protein n=1 Tax=Desulfovibrio piger TaxID=901 RepID=UPI0026EF8BCA|nr:hypothetical protein [Desulfovibrio piger]MCI7374285.1 hypothetical protein [Desulfovibrio piger]